MESPTPAPGPEPLQVGPPELPLPEPPRSEPLARSAYVAVILLAVLAVAAATVQMAVILQPLAIAIFLYFLIKPAAEGLVRCGLPEWVAYFVLLVVLFCLALGLGTMVYRNAMAFRSAWDPAVEPPKLEPGETIENPSTEVDPGIRGLKNLLRQRLVEQTGLIDEPTFSSGFDLTLSETFRYAFSASLHGAELGLMSFFYLAFFILDRHKFAHRIQRAFPPERSSQMLEVARQINDGLEQYLQVKTLVSAGMGLSSALVLYLFGVPYWVLWGFLFFALNYITYVGSIVACLPPVAVALVHYSNPWVSVWLAIALILHRLIWIDFIEIRLSGKHLNLDSILMLLSLAFWGWAWGVIGLILSVPILTTIKIVLAHLEATKGWSEMISGD